MHRYSKVNPLTCEREPRARFCRDAIVIRLSEGEARTVEFCRDRGYLPEAMSLRYREDGSASARIVRANAYAWAEQVEDDPSAFCACLGGHLRDLFHAADFRIRDSWAV